MKINKYEDISQIEREAKRDYIDRHSAFVHCEDVAKRGEKFTVKVQVGDEYLHPDDFDHYISYIQLWDGEKMLAQTNFTAGAMGSNPSQVEVDFHIVPSRKMKLTATAFCTKHGLWESDAKVIEMAD
ncbi:dethiobiotin synthase [Prolixibacteraceae bacterium JC049]|nr:dethiobiotin synthase [Prolixibacteraceae bacterium JC049]